MNQPFETNFLANTGLWHSIDGSVYHTLAIDSIDRLHGTGSNDLRNLQADVRLDNIGIITTSENFVGSLLGLDATPSTTHFYLVSSFSLIPQVSSTMYQDVTTARTATPFFNKVACGLAHSVGLAGTTMYVTGYNGQGQLGLGPNVLSTSMWTPITGDWMDIAAGLLHTAALSSDGTLLCTGLNEDGQCGRPTTEPILNIFTPVRDTRVFLTDNSIPTTPPRFNKVHCGGYHTITLSAAGPASSYNMFTMGNNLSGQLGLGVGVSNTAYLQGDTSNKNWAAVATKHVHSLALDNTGKVYSTGYNNRGQLGTNDTTTRYVWTDLGTGNPWNTLSIKSIAAGYEHSIVIDAKNHAYSVGRNLEGQLGNNGDFSEQETAWQVLSGSFKAAYTGAFASFLIYGPYLGSIR